MKRKDNVKKDSLKGFESHFTYLDLYSYIAQYIIVWSLKRGQRLLTDFMKSGRLNLIESRSNGRTQFIHNVSYKPMFSSDIRYR